MNNQSTKYEPDLADQLIATMAASGEGSTTIASDNHREFHQAQQEFNQKNPQDFISEGEPSPQLSGVDCMAIAPNQFENSL